ncbi:outer membrane protein transport protein [Marinoscillum furvescens]|uniref:Outer membrane protein transport protein (OMPP1/FadL/TodX) n=1 Tax=Marinoscillum furvescens DSM 4134 TaxID=1122208 RepID=A0A3D9LHV5_MARFU|nr:outer membrane protein transport protein [Marinoscillum furvescens]REE06001.1 outer membrane protein transport protein (OMPP1/FadL/TodX) [Marinoscillum furvescens DSM 4134]
MNKIIIMILAGIGVLLLEVSAQSDAALGYYKDVLLLGQGGSSYGGSARMQAIGAQSALGADLSSAMANPAGLGFFNRSVVSFTPSVNFQTADATYIGQSNTTFRNSFNFSNMGVAFNTNKGEYTNEKFKGGTFSITFHRVNTFNSELFYSGRNPNNSVTDSFVEDLNAGFEGGQLDYAFGQFLVENADGYVYDINPGAQSYIYPEGDFDGYTSLVGSRSVDQYMPRQTEKIVRSGGQNVLNFAWGGNFDDKVYFGGGIGFESVNYSEKKTYQENDFRDQNGDPDDLLYGIEIVDELRIEGSGIGFTGGFIVRPAAFMTVGVSYKSPVYYSLNDESGFTFSTDYNENYSYYDGTNSEGDSLYYDLGYFSESSDLLTSQYNIRTPAKVTTGLAFFIGKSGFISADLDFVDYASAQIRSSDFTTIGDNQAIRDVYQNTVNYRVGGEYRFDIFRLRAGYAGYGDPFSDSDVDGSSKQLSFGAGIRTRDYFIDFSVVNRKSQMQIAPYFVSEDTPQAAVDSKMATISATVGFNF